MALPHTDCRAGSGPLLRCRQRLPPASAASITAANAGQSSPCCLMPVSGIHWHMRCARARTGRLPPRRPRW
eukprot:7001553-Prymnesium_polylepis.1